MDQVQETKEDNASDDGGVEANPPAYVQMVDDSRLPTLSALWKLPTISVSLAAQRGTWPFFKVPFFDRGQLIAFEEVFF